MYVPLIIGALSLMEKLIPMINSWRKAAQQTGEWTDQEEAEFKARLDQITSQDHWKIE